MNNKRIIILLMTLLGLFAVPAANADVVVRYIVVDNGQSYREPFSSQRGSRLYSNTSRLGNITYSNGSQYREQCNEPRQYRNSYYSGHRNSRNYQQYNRRGGSVYYRDDRRLHGYRRNSSDGYHGYYRTPAYPDKRMHSNQGGRVHITIK